MASGEGPAACWSVFARSLFALAELAGREAGYSPQTGQRSLAVNARHVLGSRYVLGRTMPRKDICMAVAVGKYKGKPSRNEAPAVGHRPD
jgi:hypothetical protein